MVTGREIRFGLFLLIGFVVLLFVACGHNSGKANASAGTGTSPGATPAPAQTLPAVPPPASPFPVPPASDTVAKMGTTDQQVVISPTTYSSTSDACVFLPTSTSPSSAPQACAAEWKSLGVTSIPGADLMNSTAIPHVVFAGPGVSQTEAAIVGTAFYRWQAFQTWAESNTLVAAMQTLDPPGHQDPVVQALTTGGQGGQVLSVDPCNLPVQIRVVHLDAGALNYINSQGWTTTGDLAVLATYPECAGIMVAYADHSSTTVAPSSGVTAINPGSIENIPPFGSVWRITGEVPCGSDPALTTVCAGGS